MTSSSKPRLVWFDANRAIAGFMWPDPSSSNDFGGRCSQMQLRGEWFISGLLRFIGVFWLQNVLHVLAVSDGDASGQKDANLLAAIATQAKRLLIPFCILAVFHAFFLGWCYWM
jgi:hypothetical protein